MTDQINDSDPELDTYNQLRRKWLKIRKEAEKRDSSQ